MQLSVSSAAVSRGGGRKMGASVGAPGGWEMFAWLCIAALPRSPQNIYTSHQSRLRLTASSVWHELNAPLRHELPSVSSFLPFPTLWLQVIYLLYSCLCLSAQAQTCFRISGITRGGKHRLIKSTSAPPWTLISIHRCLLVGAARRGASSLI